MLIAYLFKVKVRRSWQESMRTFHVVVHAPTEHAAYAKAARAASSREHYGRGDTGLADLSLQLLDSRAQVVE